MTESRALLPFGHAGVAGTCSKVVNAALKHAGVGLLEPFGVLILASVLHFVTKSALTPEIIESKVEASLDSCLVAELSVQNPDRC